MPFVLGAAVVASAAISAYGSSKAAGTAADSANRAADLQQEQYQQTRTDLSPYMTAGTTSLAALGTGTGDLNSSLLKSPLTDLGAAPTYNMPAFDETKYKQSPGYQWNLDQGLNAVQNSAAGRTGALSGNMLKALDTYATGAASQDYWTAYDKYATDYQNQYKSLSGNYWNTADYNQNQQTNQFNRLFDITKLGQNSAAGVGTAGASAAATGGKFLTAAGDATASGITGTTNAVTGGINNLAKTYSTSPYGYGTSATSTTAPGSYGTYDPTTGGYNYYYAPRANY